ncbi:dienelactone hydrolase family protein [Acuticoccus kandeliae]|uniref:dienelactone hydrolase family protein n=1 Tax=Acuticoccus kandeliae TaxID=2073160 RepID=UPI000D3E831B|nr:dienelactone hydrolase family protein [Acuticoccus kandeliae]
MTERLDRIRLRSASPREATSGARPDEIEADVYRPVAGIGGPAVVISEGLVRPDPAHAARYGRLLGEHGFTVLVIDSAAARGRGRASRPLRTLAISEMTMAGDAYAALNWIAHEAGVDPARIHHIGFGTGGTAAALTAYAQVHARYAAEGRAFASHVSVYGPPIVRLEDYRTTGAPVAFITGERDATIDGKRLGLVVGDLENGGSRVARITIPAARHQWDGTPGAARAARLDLARLCLRLTPENRMIDEATGRAADEGAGRLVAIARAIRLNGPRIEPDADATRESDSALLRLLGAA